MSIGEIITIITFVSGIIGFLIKNYTLLQKLDETVNKLNLLIDQTKEKQGLVEDEVIKLNEQIKSLWNNLKENNERIRDLERRGK
ncbi:hypothetical protein HRG89_08240 [Enterococcus faecalis]|nr:hypothetical protein [Enterococcus faecalis]